MKSKQAIAILIVFALILTLCSCGRETKMTNSTETWAEGFKTNNNPVNSTQVLYSIEELKNFFDDQWGVQLKDINDRFSIEYLRKVQVEGGHDSYYIVYPVSEGGKFLLFLISCIGRKDYQDDEMNLCSADYLYVNELTDEKVFDNVDGNCTYDDIKALAPSTYYSFTKSSSTDSYTLLNNGMVMACTYERTGDQKVISHKVIAVDDVTSPFRYLIKQDLIP